jgi:hypothetical protein
MSEFVEIEFEGKTYKLGYAVERGMITVRTVFDSKSAEIGSLPLVVLVQIVGRELLEDAKRKGLL